MDHMLTLMEVAPYTSKSSICHLYLLPSTGPVYHCSICQYDIHPGWTGTGSIQGHFLHAEHPLRCIESNGQSLCDGCGLRVRSIAYNCPAPCNFNLHPICACVPMYIQHPFHTHILKLITVDAISSAAQPCLACDRELGTSSYRCTVCEDVGLHIYCWQLPWAPKPPSHPNHCMHLKVGANGSTGSLTCNACQQPTKLKWLYQCQECVFNLHTDCANLPHHIPGESVATSSSLQTRREMHQTIQDIIIRRHRMQPST